MLLISKRKRKKKKKKSIIDVSLLDRDYVCIVKSGWLRSYSYFTLSISTLRITTTVVTKATLFCQESHANSLIEPFKPFELVQILWMKYPEFRQLLHPGFAIEIPHKIASEECSSNGRDTSHNE